MPPTFERPSPAEQTAPAACLPAPAAAGQGVGTPSLQAQHLSTLVELWEVSRRIKSPDPDVVSLWQNRCVEEAGRIISGDYCLEPGRASGTGNKTISKLPGCAHTSGNETGGVVPGTSCTTGNETRTGRPAVHATAAKRKAAYRAAKARIDYTDSPEIVAKLHEIAAEFDCSVNELLRSMVRFAQTNRNWKQLGLFGARRNGELL